MNKSAGLCLNLTIAFMLVATVISLASSSCRYKELTIAIDTISAEIETHRQNREELLANDKLDFNEEDIERIIQNAKPPCPLKVSNSIVFFP